MRCESTTTSNDETPDNVDRFQPAPPKMSMFRAKKLDLGCFVNIKVIRDHSKRKTFEKFEAER